MSDKQVTSNPNRAGRIWALDLETNVLKAVFVSNDITVGNSPDNLCVSPRGGVLFNEDGSGSGRNAAGQTISVPAQRLMALLPDGSSYEFANNNYNFTVAQLAAAGNGNFAVVNFGLPNTYEFELGDPRGYGGTNWGINIAGLSAGDTFTLALDVPEPGSLPLMLAGLLGLGAMLRRRAPKA